MTRSAVAAVSALLAAVGVLFLLAVEARLVHAGERKLAAAASGLAALAAVILLLLLTLLAGHVTRRLRAGRTVGQAAEAPPAEPSLEAKGAGPRP